MKSLSYKGAKMCIPAKSFVETLAVNIDNEKLSDAEFRQFCRNTVPIVEGIDYPKSTTPEGSTDEHR